MSDKEKPNMKHHVHVVHAMGHEKLTEALMFLVAGAMKNGVTEAGEQMTVMIPPGIEMGFTEDGPMDDIGEWEITLKKVS